MFSRSLLVDFYELTMSQCYFDERRGYAATFDLFVRELPPHRSFLVAAGLADVLDYVSTLRFSGEDIAYLRSRKMFSGAFLDYLRDFRFTGDLWAMPEGTVFFPSEPVVRITADIIQAQVIESYLLSTVNFQTMIATKASRIVSAAQGKPVYDFSLRRTHGPEAGLKAARSAYIAGCAGTATVLAGKLYGIPVAGTMAHSFVMSFPSEPEAFSVYSREFPGATVLLVDTYDPVVGIRNAIRAGKELRARGGNFLGIRLDSGDLARLSVQARKMLNAAGLRNAKIMASGNLDEYGIARLCAAKAPIDSFGVGTRMGASFDAPSLDCIYKLSEISAANGQFLPAMKLSPRKRTYPGRKQVYRVYDRRGNLVSDTIGLEGEDLPGVPLLVQMVKGGRRVRPLPQLAGIRERTAAQVKALPDALKGVRGERAFRAGISPGLARVTRRLRTCIAGRQNPAVSGQ